MSNQQGDDVANFSNVEAEAALLGALMIDNRLVGDTAHIIDASMFVEPLHARIYKVIVKLVERSKLANPVTLRPVFEHDRAMQQIGGVAYLATLTGSGAAIIGARDFAEQIRDLAHLRNIKDAVASGLEQFSEDANIDNFLSEVEIATAQASTSMRTVEIRSAEEMVGNAAARVDKSLEQGVPGASCKTIRDIDTLVGRLEGQQMTLLAGRPGMGKSTIAVSAGLGYAMNGHPVLYLLAESSEEMFSLKMTADLLHAMGKEIPFKNLKEGILSNEERRWVEEAKAVAATLPFHFAYVGRSDLRRVRAVCAQMQMKMKRRDRKLEVIIADYLQLFTAEGRHKPGDDRGRINAVSEGFLSIAQDLDTHMIALSQLSRAVEQREDKRPRLSDLRESGRLEEDCDNCLMAYRAEYYLENSKPHAEKDLAEWEIEMGAARGKVDLIAAKTRFGRTSDRKCNFLGQFSAVRGSNWTRLLNGEDDTDDLFERGYS